ncbi:MAG: cell division protein FtsA [Blastocatellia bacterium]|nr:cell division protein FtsA [Blastocatellia bacterium]MCS7157038.1 cell division protein FtsA [Blastocatellia bacterium]MCX7752239.1 cell division protein FtsA [Blastocatellia bacterium]MDW8167730.1 cell division protein FtsA [Acidobacteriota bacterium]MDW8256330.1 cell division protein FtsA [Acidobacteriota bacterium]
MARQETHVVGLDIGTTRTTAVIAEVNDDGRLEIMGVGTAESRGLRKGVIVNPDAAAEPIRRAVEEAERMSGLIAESVHVSMSGTLLRGLNNRGVIAITNADRRITRADIKRVIETACVVTLPGGHEIIDVQPQEYIIDGQDGISDPLDMLGTRLEVAVHIITGPITVRQNIISAVNRAGLLVADIVLEPVAAAEATLTDDEREYGSAVINIGGETTSLAIYQRGAVQHTAIFPFGGSHFTNDIAFGLRTPIPEAERIKRTYGCVLPALAAESDETIEVPSVGRRPPRALSRQLLCEILQPRAEEILGYVNEEIKRAGFERELSSGIILTGGGALLQGLTDLAEQIFDHPTRLGYPLGVTGLSEETNSPLYTTAIGLVMIAHRGRLGRYYRTTSASGAISRTAARVRSWLANFF